MTHLQQKVSPMNAIMYAINEIKSVIPYEIIYAGMTLDEDPQLLNLSSLEDKVLNKVFKKRVLLAANVIGGIETIIPIRSVHPTFTEPMYTVYHIPPELTMDKEIMSVLSLAYLPTAGFMGVTGGFGGPNMVNSAGHGGGTATMNVANRIASSVNTTGLLSSAHLEIVARNTIAVYAHYQALTNYGLRVVLQNDENLNNIQPRSYPALSKLAVLACKSYLYNKLIIPINSGYLSGGQDLGMFKSMLESYSDAEEQYQMFLREVWGQVAFMNDTTRYSNYLAGMLAPDL